MNIQGGMLMDADDCFCVSNDYTAPNISGMEVGFNTPDTAQSFNLASSGQTPQQGLEFGLNS